MTYETFLSETININDARVLYNGTRQTFAKAAKLARDNDYRFIAGNNPALGSTRKWSTHAPVRVAQTNSRRHGRSIQTLWAVRW